jgi:hypothetical protein
MGGMNRDEVLAAFKATGLQAASVCCHTHWEKPLSAPDEATRQIGLEGLVLSLRDAHAYGATSVLLVPGVARDGVSYRQCFERSIVEIKKAIPVAQETGVRIAIENVGNNFIMSPEAGGSNTSTPSTASGWAGISTSATQAASGRPNAGFRCWANASSGFTSRTTARNPRTRQPKGTRDPNCSTVTPTGLR